MANFGSTFSSSTNKWHSTATHTSSINPTGHGFRSRPSIPLSEISTNVKTAVSTKCIYFKEVISVNNSAAQLPMSSSELGSCSECECGELSSDEYPSEMKIKSISIIKNQENSHESTQEMGSLAQFLNHSLVVHSDISLMSQKINEKRKLEPLSSSRHESDVPRHVVPENRLRSTSSSSTPRIESPIKTRRLSEHLSTTIQRQKTRHEQRHHTYAQLKDLAQRRLNVVAELVNLDEQYEATLAKLLLPANH